MHRNGLIRAAACAALACAGLTASVAAAPAALPAAAELSLARPVYLQDNADTARMPLMAMLDRVGLAKPLDDAKINIGGHVEGSYTYSFRTEPGNVITGRLFDFENQDPTLNQAVLFAERTVDDAIANNRFDIGARAEVMYGGDARFIHGLGVLDHRGFYNVPEADPNGDVQFDLTQAYVDVAIPVGNGLRARIGKFVTPLGQEVINPSGNALYSHSYLFNYAIPLTHTGVLLTYNISDSLAIDAGVTRGWDTALEDDNDTVDFLGRLTFKIDENSTLLVSATVGPDQPGNNDDYRTVVDVIYTRKLSDQLSIALNADYGREEESDSSISGSTAQWYGAALYASYVVSPQVTVNLRGEYFNDEDGARLTGAAGGTSVWEATAGLAITPFPDSALGRNLIIRPEIRFDYANKNFFSGGDEHSQFTAAVDAIYKF